MSDKQRELSDAERTSLKQELTAKFEGHTSESLGFKVRGQEMQAGAPFGQVPESLDGADVSVCGVKGFVHDQVRKFTRPDGTTEVVDCASVAALEITDSPVHMHGYTQELYYILNGTGEMVLGNEIKAIRPGSVIVLPPGIEHGVVSDDPEIPVKVLLSFTPGLAPKGKPEFRDEAILYERTSDRIAQLRGETTAKVSEL